MVVIFRWQVRQKDVATGAVDSTLIVDGTGEGVTGSIVEVISGNYALSDGATLTGNTTTEILAVQSTTVRMHIF